MSYTRTEWVDTYKNEETGEYYLDSGFQTPVTEDTPKLDAAHLNNIEDGIAERLPLDGGAMLGELLLHKDPEKLSEAVTLNYLLNKFCVIGTYVGDNNELSSGKSPRTIELGFRPKMVIVLNNGRFDRGGVFAVDDPEYYLYRSEAFKIVDNGFVVDNTIFSADSLNYYHNCYAYVAFR